MKPSLSLPVHQGVSPAVSGLSNFCKTLIAVFVAAGMGSGIAFSQAAPPGNYYPNGTPGSGINGGTFNELAYVNSLLSAGLSIYYPVPVNDSSPSATVLLAAVNTAVQHAIAGTVPAQYPGITVASLASQLLANPPPTTTQSQLVDQIAKTIIANSSSTAAIASLDGPNGVIATLAATYPTTFSTFSQPIFAEAAANSGTATQISQIALAATNAVSSNSQAVGAIVGQALNAVVNNTAGLTSAQIQSTLLGAIGAQFGSSNINGSLASISAVAASMTTSAVTAAVSPSAPTAMSSILSTAVNALPTADKAGTLLGNTSVGAIAVGALVSASNATVVTEIQQDLASENAATATYTTMVVNGYNNTSTAAAYNSYVQSNQASADAIVAGATVKGSLTPTQLITGALDGTGSTIQSGTAAILQNIVASAVTADLTRTAGSTTDDASAIAGAAVLAIASPTTANLSSIATGAVDAARVTDAGMITKIILTDATASAGNVQAVVGGAVTAAFANGNQGAAIAAIVYNAEVAATGTAPTTAVTYAINSMKAAGATNT
jgi:hypothetical protein